MIVLSMPGEHFSSLLSPKAHTSVLVSSRLSIHRNPVLGNKIFLLLSNIQKSCISSACIACLVCILLVSPSLWFSIILCLSQIGQRASPYETVHMLRLKHWLQAGCFCRSASAAVHSIHTPAIYCQHFCPAVPSRLRRLQPGTYRSHRSHGSPFAQPHGHKKAWPQRLNMSQEAL